MVSFHVLLSPYKYFIPRNFNVLERMREMQIAAVEVAFESAVVTASQDLEVGFSRLSIFCECEKSYQNSCLILRLKPISILTDIRGIF